MIRTTRSCLLAAALAAATAAAPSQGEVIVSWGPAGDIVTGNINISEGKNDTSIDFDAFTSPSSPAYYPNDAGKTPDFYAATVASYGGSVVPVANWRIDNVSPRDRVFSNYNGPSGTNSNNVLEHIMLWNKPQFLNGGDGNPADLTGMSLEVDGNTGTAFARFVVEVNDTTYFASERFTEASNMTLTASFSDTSSLNWFSYNPEVDFTVFGPAVPSPDFSNVTSVGLYYGNERVGQFNQAYFYALEATADVVIPEPASLALVGLGGLLCLGRRRG